MPDTNQYFTNNQYFATVATNMELAIPKAASSNSSKEAAPCIAIASFELVVDFLNKVKGLDILAAPTVIERITYFQNKEEVLCKIAFIRCSGIKEQVPVDLRTFIKSSILADCWNIAGGQMAIHQSKVVAL